MPERVIDDIGGVTNEKEDGPFTQQLYSDEHCHTVQHG
jgi:hypothetical protein